jgi:hypothetical protein
MEPECKHELNTLQVRLKQACQAKLFLCIFHAHKACCENMMGKVRSSAHRTEMGERLTAFFQARDEEHAHQLLGSFRQRFGSEYPNSVAYVQKNWATPGAMAKWGLWHRSQHRDIDATTNFVESHWNLIKHRVLDRRVNVDPIELVQELVGTGTNIAGSLFVQILHMEVAAYAGAGAVKKSVKALDRAHLAAAAIAQRGGIRRYTGRVYLVPSSDGKSSYRVNAARSICDCLAAQKAKTCKHIIALRLYHEQSAEGTIDVVRSRSQVGLARERFGECYRVYKHGGC